MGQENSLPNGDRDEGDKCPECGHAPHLPGVCYEHTGPFEFCGCVDDEAWAAAWGREDARNIITGEGEEDE